jgi:hypothetical protein
MTPAEKLAQKKSRGSTATWNYKTNKYE